MCLSPRHSNRFPLTLDASVDPDDEAALPLVVPVGFEDERGLVARGLDVAGAAISSLFPPPHLRRGVTQLRYLITKKPK